MKKIFLIFIMFVNLSVQACFWGSCEGTVKYESSSQEKKIPDFSYRNDSIDGHIHDLELVSQKTGNSINLMPYGRLFYYQQGYRYLFDDESFFKDEGCLFDLKGWGRIDRGDYERYNYSKNNLNVCYLEHLQLF